VFYRDRSLACSIDRASNDDDSRVAMPLDAIVCDWMMRQGVARKANDTMTRDDDGAEAMPRTTNEALGVLNLSREDARDRGKVARRVRELALESHPDAGAGRATSSSTFRAVMRAREILRDADGGRASGRGMSEGGIGEARASARWMDARVARGLACGGALVAACYAFRWAYIAGEAPKRKASRSASVRHALGLDGG